MSHASPESEFGNSLQTSLDTQLGYLGQNQSISFYSPEKLEARSFISHLDVIHQKEVSGIYAACDAIQGQKKLCLAHPASCHYNQKSISKYEKTIRIRSQSLSLFKAVCVPSLDTPSKSIIAKCHGDFNWIPGKSKTEKLISLSPYYARFTSLFLQDAINSIHRATNSQHMIKNLLSHSEVFLPSSYEKFHTVIDQIVANVYTNFTTSEQEELTDLSTKHTSIASMAMPISGSDLKCENMLLVRTAITPVLNPRTKKEVVIMDGRLIEKYGNHSTYILLPQNSAVSKETSSLDQATTLIGRSCIIHRTINATFTKSNDTLIEILSFQLVRNLRIRIVCPGNNSLSSNTKTLTSGNYNLNLPLVCSLHSDRINCEAVALNSKVIPDEGNKFNSTSSITIKKLELQTHQSLSTPLLEKAKWPIIGTLTALAILAIIGLICLYKVKKGKLTSSNNAAPVYNSRLYAPSCPSASQIQDDAPAQGIFQPTNAAIAIKRLLAIPTEIRSSSETEALIVHMENELISFPQV